MSPQGAKQGEDSETVPHVALNSSLSFMATSDPEYVSDRPKVKMIVVGDPGVGKTSLIATFAARMFARA